MRQLVVTVHGIRTFGGWQEKLEGLLASRDSERSEKVEVYNYKYGYFSVLAFVFPPASMACYQEVPFRPSCQDSRRLGSH